MGGCCSSATPAPDTNERIRSQTVDRLEVIAAHGHRQPDETPPAQLNMRYTEPDEIFAAAASGNVTLLSLKWLLEWAQSGRKLPRQQELPPDAILTVERLKALHAAAQPHVQRAVLPIIAISYCWLTVEHPDPEGVQLQHVADMLKWHGQDNQPWIDDYYEDFGVFWDWASIPQKDPLLFDPAETPANKPPEDRDAFIADIKSGCRFFGGESYENSRSAEEKVKFKRALCDTMDLWYSHRGTVVVLVTQMPPGYVTSGGRDYESRGWTTFERCSAELIKPVEAYVVPDGQDVIFGYYLWPMCIDTARVGEAGAGRRPPATPEVFAELMESCSFTNEADVAQVRILYETVATAVLAATDELMLTNMVIKPGSGRHVQLALDMCPNLQKFMLDGSCIEPIDLRQALRAKPALRCTSLYVNDCFLGEEGGVVLFDGLKNGVFPNVEIFGVRKNNFGERAGKALAELISSGAMPKLQDIFLDENELTPAGAMPIIEALGKGAIKRMKHVLLDDSHLGPDVGMALVRLLEQGAPELRELGVGSCDLGAQTGLALIKVMTSGAIPKLDLTYLENNELGAEVGMALLDVVQSDRLKFERIWINQIGEAFDPLYEACQSRQILCHKPDEP